MHSRSYTVLVVITSFQELFLNQGAIFMMTQYKTAATRAVNGMVNSQAVAISCATPQRTLFTRSAEPTPMMDELTTWVVETGPPTSEAPRMTIAEASWEENPSTGRILKNFPPSVRISLQPPRAVPRAIIVAHIRMTH